MSLIPYGGRVVVRADRAAESSSGGVFIPDIAVQKASDRGTVVAVGPGELGDDGQRRPMPVSPGQRVYFKKGMGMGIVDEDERYILLEAKEIVGIDDTSLAG